MPVPHTLTFRTPSKTWDTSLPLGNGLLGAMIWGDGAPLNVSLDRTDLWDLRSAPEFQSSEYTFKQMHAWVEAGNVKELRRLLEDPYGKRAYPTKIPAGRLEFTLPSNLRFQHAELALADGVAEVTWQRGRTKKPVLRATGLLHATRIAGRIDFVGAAATFPTVHVRAPQFMLDPRAPKDPKAPPPIQGLSLSSLGYPHAQPVTGADHQGYIQRTATDLSYAVVVAWVDHGNARAFGWSIATSAEALDLYTLALVRARAAAAPAFDAFAAEHRAWWQRYWKQAAIDCPDKTIQRLWEIENYKFGAAARKDTPPITLQGPWTADDGGVPPWKGDYHHDLNTQLSYWPCYSGNHLDEGSGFLSWLWDTKPACEAYTRRFYNLPGFNVPMTADLNNNQIGGWHMYAQSPTTAAWLSHHFYLHWQFSADPDFLAERAWPYLSGAAEFLAAHLETRRNGKLYLPLSSSPEIHSNALNAWFHDWTNYDLALTRWLFLAAAEMADALGLTPAAKRFRKLETRLPRLALDRTGKLLMAPGEALEGSHRHLSHLMAIHPLGLIQWEQGGAAQQTFKAALSELKRLGPGGWCGYSWAWLSNLHAWAKDGAAAARDLTIFSKYFTLRSSFHCNGDRTGTYSDSTGQPFTLEGNFAAQAGVQEMLLQSHAGHIEVFPAIPKTWSNVSFQTLRARGAFLVSASRKNGRTELLRITTERGGRLVLADPFHGAAFHVATAHATPAARDANKNLVFRCEPGATVTLTRQ